MKTIPKLLHINWIGNPDKTPWENIESWKEKHPDWEFKLWGNKELEDYAWRHKDIMNEYKRIGVWPGVADIMRHQVLYDMGGFVAPADSVCLHNIESLLKGAEILGIYENEKARPGLMSPIIASRPKHPLLKEILETMTPQYIGNRIKRPVFVTGNYHVTNVVKSKDWKGLKIMPSYRLFPIHFTGEVYQGRGKVYAVHVWGDTTARGKGIGEFKIEDRWK